MRSTFDFGRALTFMFEEVDWVKKYLIALVVILLSVFILPAFLLTGYQVEIMRGVMRGQNNVLPEWGGKLGDYFRDGILAAIAQFVYSLPLILLAFCMVVPLAMSADPDTGELAGLGVLALCCLMAVIFLGALAVALFYMAGLIRFARSRQFSSFFQFREIMATLRSRDFLPALGTAIVANFVGGLVPFIATPWGMFATAHALGQAGRALGPVAGERPVGM